MKNTKIICAFPACGKSYLYENNKDLIILDSDSSSFSWITRKRTKTELQQAMNGYVHMQESYPTMMAPEGYINSIKDTLIKVKNPEFPNNYIEHIKNNIGKVDYIFVSTHKEVRDALKEAGVSFILVFPEKDLKAEWIGRCFLRGSDEKFCNLIAQNWDNWIKEMEEESKYCDFYKLKHGEYLSDAIENMKGF